MHQIPHPWNVASLTHRVILKDSLSWSSVTKLYLTLCDTIDRRVSGFLVLHYLLDLAQIHVHWVSDANHLLLCHPLSSCFQSFPVSGSLLMNCLFGSGEQSIEASASASVLPVNIQGSFYFFCALTFCRGLFNILEIYSNAFIMLAVLFPFIFFPFLSFLLFFHYTPYPHLSLSLSHTHISVFPAEMKPVLITN